MYKLTQPMFRQTEPSCIVRTTDNASIPFDPQNSDFQEYQRWLAEGHTPEPADTQE